MTAQPEVAMAVANLATSVTFYVERLGFLLVRTWPSLQTELAHKQ
jgi:catechol 2,3-dioxygenase-like lactoylglutathione lyase family enzyme